MKILGIDIGNGLATCFLLDTDAPAPGKSEALDGDSYRAFSADAQGIKGLLALNPDMAIMEPTGTNYSRLWGTHLARCGVEVRLVGHSALAAYRSVLQIPDKDDELDAYALAMYALAYKDDRLRFAQVRDPAIAKMREKVLRLAHLNRVQSPIINRLKQDLAWQFPEASKTKATSISTEPPLLWRWLAGEAPCQRYDKKYANTCGLGLTETVRLHAARLCDLQREERQLEKELTAMLDDPRYIPYRKVFTQFGFGLRMQCMLLSQIFPLENFLENGLPIVEMRKGRKSGKPTTRHISANRFQKACGLAPTESSSGKFKSKQIVGGSDLCRTHFWLWHFTRVEPLKARSNHILKQIAEWENAPERQGKPIQLLRISACCYACKLLFKALVAEIVK